MWALAGVAGGGSLCLLSLAVFLDGQPLTRVASRSDLGPGRYVVEAAAGRAILADNPEGRRVEVSAARFAFRSRAADVRIKGLVVEKYDTPTQMGAIRGGDGTGWRVEDSQIRLNAGLGVDVGSDGAITGSTIERNGQLGAAAQGQRILIENNRIAWNNTAGFDPEWEAGGLKITQSQEVVLAREPRPRQCGSGPLVRHRFAATSCSRRIRWRTIPPPGSSSRSPTTP